MLTQVHNFSEELRLHALIIDEAAKSFRKFSRRANWGLVTIVALIALGCVISFSAGAAVWIPILIGALAVGAMWGGIVVTKRLKHGFADRVRGNLGELFQKLHARDVLVRDHTADLDDLWKNVKDRTKKVIDELGLVAFKRLKKTELKNLDYVLGEEIPELRAKLHRGVQERVSET